MNKKLVTTFAFAATLLVGSVASAANWNGLENYPEVPNSANGTERIPITSGRCCPKAAGITMEMICAMLVTTEVFAISTPGFAIAAAPFALKPYTRIPIRTAAPIRVEHIIRAGPA